MTKWADPLANFDWKAWDASTPKIRVAPTPPARPSLAQMRRRWAKRLLQREYEGLRLYEPLPLAAEFHACNAQWRVLGGSNRAGKSLAASAESASVLLGQHWYNAYPTHNGFALFVGLSRKHLALMYRTMFLPGAFKIIPDEKTKLYRAVRYDRNNPTKLQEYDLAYQEKWRDAPPLVPERLVHHIAFDVPEVPRTIRMRHNGWRSLWQSAAGKAPQGEHINYAQFDEEMPDPEFYVETHRGLTRKEGEPWKQRPKAVWSATSQIANPELAELRERAAIEGNEDLVREFLFTIDNNPYFSSAARQEFFDGLSSEDRQTRYYGIPATTVRRIYPTYNAQGDAGDGSGHGCEPFAVNPRLYTRYVIVNPSVTHCASIFVAIDPQEQFLTVYDGFDLEHATARLWAKEVADRQNGVKFEAIIFDYNMGKQSLQGRDRTTVAAEYFAALQEQHIELRQYGSLNGFFPANPDRAARIQCLLKTMEVRGCGPFEGSCRLRVMRGLLPALDRQIRRAQTDPKNPDKWLKDPKVPMDLLETAEYASAADLRYVRPEGVETTYIPPVVRAYQKKQRERRRREKVERRRQSHVYSSVLTSH